MGSGKYLSTGGFVEPLVKVVCNARLVKHNARLSLALDDDVTPQLQPYSGYMATVQILGTTIAWHTQLIIERGRRRVYIHVPKALRPLLESLNNSFLPVSVTLWPIKIDRKRVTKVIPNE